ncbi:Rap30/74 interaction domain-containing protein [Zopfia rhizophila CBS 207.26]|uniref:Rap30/74 interaction domain-containing protein n=1 Tax=Zopfia rhizophila CBS 207.26 TaxID=1314779 RepID=A0A6A6DMD2_9PEZI|nr:Rap30/74 interaction domain-containing protein [Zopfia rhizophila CBS 207.26]
MTQIHGATPAPTGNANSTNNPHAISLETARQEYIARGAVSIPLVVSRRDLRELRHHVMRLQQGKDKGQVDICNEQQFMPPIRLHRRDPRAPPSGAGSHFVEEDTKEDIEEIKERERLENLKEERRRIREENQAKIAPSTTKKPPAFQKKTEQKYRPDDTPEAEKRRLLRYEETLPWHLEDFENKQTWVGSYESELSESHVMLTTAYENNRDVIQMVPLERWYRFNTKGKGKTYTAEEADQMYKTSGKMPTFLSKVEQISMKKEQQEAIRGRGAGRMKTRVGGGDDDERGARRRGDDDMPTIKREADADDIDFNLEDDFADDEEGLNGLFEGDEAEIKDAAERLKRDQLQAAAFELRNEEDVYRQEEAERLQAETQKKLEKSLRKALTKREKNFDYESSDSNPYESSSDSDTDSETERQRQKEEEERKAAEQNGKAIEGDKIASGTSTKGTTTPSGIHKLVDINKKKRPGSPNLSEASGNESSRKKHKKKHLDSSRKTSLVHLAGANESSRRAANSGSDSELTDAGKKKHKLKVKLGTSPTGTPSGSRAGSPAASQMNGSRAGSPVASTAVPVSSSNFPSASEIYNSLPPEGIEIQPLMALYRGRVGTANTKIFTAMVKCVSDYNKATKKVFPLPEMPSQDVIDAAVEKATQPAKQKPPTATPA